METKNTSHIIADSLEHNSKVLISSGSHNILMYNTVID